MKWVEKIRNAKMIAFSQFPIGAELNIMITPISAPFLNTKDFSGEMYEKYLGMTVRVYIPSDEEADDVPPVLIMSDSMPCLGIAVLWDAAILVRECED